MIIATLESVLILEKAEQLARMIVSSETAEEYRFCHSRLQEDKEAQQLIAAFSHMKIRYEEVQRFGRYHPDYTYVSQEIRQLKRELDLHETIVAFKKAETAMQNLLDDVSVSIGSEISPYIKVPTGNPFFDAAGGCSGGCGSGGSCGCKKTG